ncbi:hypothetical protein MKEN_00277400 [Mycena kentingensis (nom. inval.)]|nr:hypothetical protein MKEN_00277400 [Mycena kentingensis (nom. inval.)]
MALSPDYWLKWCLSGGLHLALSLFPVCNPARPSSSLYDWLDTAPAALGHEMRRTSARLGHMLRSEFPSAGRQVAQFKTAARHRGPVVPRAALLVVFIYRRSLLPSSPSSTHPPTLVQRARVLCYILHTHMHTDPVDVRIVPAHRPSYLSIRICLLPALSRTFRICFM